MLCAMIVIFVCL